MELLARIAKPRPVGTPQNQEITEDIGVYLERCGYEVKKVPFDCKVWETQESFLRIGEKEIGVQVSPYSEGFAGMRKAVVVTNFDELKDVACENKLLFLTGELTEEELQPKDYPFYYPEEHKAIIDCLEEKNPCAIISVTGKSMMSGLDPFPVIEDGNFHIPVGSIGKNDFAEVQELLSEREIEIAILSENHGETAYQLIASKKVPDPQGTIAICAHMDSKYHTDGALDNASGVATMLLAAKGIKTDKYNIDIVPFNSEEYYDPQGELIYLEEIQKTGKEIALLINIDTLAYTGSKVAVSTFNIDGQEKQKLDDLKETCENIVEGTPWYAGDHAAFVFGGTKCILLSASDLFEECIHYTHCPKDTMDRIDEGLIEDAAEYLCKVIHNYSMK